MGRYLIVAHLLACALSSPARAQPAVAVLGLESIGAPAAMAQRLTDALRHRLASTAGIRVIAGKDLVEMKLIFGCYGDSPACLAKAGRSLGADKLLFGSVQRGNALKVVVVLKVLDVQRAALERLVKEMVPKRDLAKATVRDRVARWMPQLIEIEPKSTLTVQSEPPGAAVTVDGRMLGRTPLTLDALAPGAHSVSVSFVRRVTQTRTVELRPGGTHELNVTLETLPEPAVATVPSAPAPAALARAAPAVTARAPEHAGRTAKIIALTAAGLTVAAGAATLATWLSYRSFEDQAHADVLSIQGAAGGSDPWFANPLKSRPDCSTPYDGQNLAGVQSYHSHCQSGQSYATATSYLWVAVGAFAATSVTSWIVGTVQSARGRERRLGELRLQPVVSLTGAAVTATLNF